jgi:hypothetical protein
MKPETRRFIRRGLSQLEAGSFRSSIPETGVPPFDSSTCSSMWAEHR